MNLLHFIPLFGIGLMIGWLTDLKWWQYAILVVLIVAYRYLP